MGLFGGGGGVKKKARLHSLGTMNASRKAAPRVLVQKRADQLQTVRTSLAAHLQTLNSITCFRDAAG